MCRVCSAAYTWVARSRRVVTPRERSVPLTLMDNPIPNMDNPTTGALILHIIPNIVIPLGQLGGRIDKPASSRNVQDRNHRCTRKPEMVRLKTFHDVGTVCVKLFYDLGSGHLGGRSHEPASGGDVRDQNHLCTKKLETVRLKPFRFKAKRFV